MSEKTNYIGLTIGPIFPTLGKLKSTRALFAGSYIFSYTMREILSQLLKNGIAKQQILTPSVSDLELIANEKLGVGLYADRMIMEAREGDFEKLLEARKAVINLLHNHIVKDIGLEAEEIQLFKDYLSQYFQLYCFESVLEKGEETFKQINEILDTLELNRSFPEHEADQLVGFLNRKKTSFLTIDAFKGKNKRFPTLVEIASAELRTFNESAYQNLVKTHIQNTIERDSDAEENDEFIKEIQVHPTFKNHFRTYHKYIAIVTADGDSIGKYIKGLEGDSEAFAEFSDQLLRFSREAARLIEKYGGAPVYIGGDDLLFFAPVANRIQYGSEDKFETIFDLVTTLDKKFQEYFPKQVGNPTISYGISFSYYKYPMNEARELSYEMLLKAKNKKQFASKNAIYFRLQKHSGFFTEAGFEKGTPAYQLFLIVLSASRVSHQFINSITHGLNFHRQTINYLMDGKSKGTQRLQYFFENNFDEAVHHDNKQFISSIVRLTVQLYSDYPLVYSVNQTIGNQPLDKLYALLRFVHLLRSENDE